MPVVTIRMPPKILWMAAWAKVPVPRSIDVYLDVTEDRVLEWTRGVIKQLNRLGDAFDKMSEEMLKIFEERFAKSGDPAWKPPSPNTLFAKAMAKDPKVRSASGAALATRIGRLKAVAAGQSRKGLLVDSGDYRSSWVDRGHTDHVSVRTATSVAEGSRHFLAAIHEKGTSPYTIRPRYATKLSFMTVNGIVHTGKVNHPGLAARPVATVNPEDVAKMLKILYDHVGGFR